MGEPVTNGDHPLDLADTRRTLLSNSTKRRVAELQTLCDRLDGDDLPASTTLGILAVLADTYALYVDTRSRQAVEKCISTVATSSHANTTLPRFIAKIQDEAGKPGIARGSAYVLVRWSSLLIQHASLRRSTWIAWGKGLVSALTSALDTFLASNPRGGTVATSKSVSRRAFRSLARADFGPQALDECITTLTAKGSGACPQNSIPLGIIAGVCDRLPARREVIISRKHDFFAFYVREILGSRTRLPAYVAQALQDFFAGFVNLEDLKEEVAPAFEKGLLRAPEVVLNDLVSPIIAALPLDMDLSEVLRVNLLKPLLSNIKSGNAEIREGAVRTYETTAMRCHNDAAVGKISDEILGPLRSNKLSGAEQRAIHANMLAALAGNPSVFMKVPHGLLAVASKEANEAAASAELGAIAACVAKALVHDGKLDSSIPDAFAKGLSDKRLPMRRLWALSLGDVLWQLDNEAITKAGITAIGDACVGKLIDIFSEVAANPVPALQTGQVAVAYAATALCLSSVPRMVELKAASLVKKASLPERALTPAPKPSFLLNARVYTKLAIEEDLRWFQRALVATFAELPRGDKGQAVRKSWAQAFIYLVVSVNSPPSICKETLDALRSLYNVDPVVATNVIMDGLWQWCEDVETENRDSAAFAAKSGRADLFKVVRTICPAADSTLSSSSLDTSDRLQSQMTALLVLCRPQLLPRAPWIELCLLTGADPGRLAKAASQECLKQILTVTESSLWMTLPAFQAAAYSAAAELAFVAPDVMTPLVVTQIASDLDPSQLATIGPTEAAIYRTPEGIAFVDVLSKQLQTQPVSKNTKDYDTIKWEEELRTQIAQKKGQTKKLTAEEQSKVSAQLVKESQIRNQVAEVDARLRRGIGIISALATGPPTEAEAWFGPAVSYLFGIIEAGGGLILGDTASLGYLQCADRTSSRLGALRPFVGVATLRSAGVTLLPDNLLAEPLGDLVTRLLYRLRFLGEQRPFDTVTLSYILALIFLVLENGGIDRAPGDDADEQIVLAVEFLSFHTE
ncbi:translational activator of GCN4, partial [Teratosphaeriaceae sp. CCFEE 6253]